MAEGAVLTKKLTFESNEGEVARARWRAATRNLPKYFGPWAYLNWGDLILTNQRLIFVRLFDRDTTLDLLMASMDAGFLAVIPFPKAFPGKRDALALSEIAEARPVSSTQMDIVGPASAVTHLAVGRAGLNLGPWSAGNEQLRDEAVVALNSALASAR